MSAARVRFAALNPGRRRRVEYLAGHLQGVNRAGQFGPQRVANQVFHCFSRILTSVTPNDPPANASNTDSAWRSVSPQSSTRK